MTPVGLTPTPADESPDDLIRQRLRKLEELRARGIDPYPASFERTAPNGEIVGSGTHDELLIECPTYAEIVDSQLSAEEAAA